MTDIPDVIVLGAGQARFVLTSAGDTMTVPDGATVAIVPPGASLPGWIGVPQLLTAAEVGRRCRRKAWWVGEQRREGRLAAVCFGGAYLYRPADVQAFIDAHLEQGPA